MTLHNRYVLQEGYRHPDERLLVFVRVRPPPDASPLVGAEQGSVEVVVGPPAPPRVAAAVRAARVAVSPPAVAPRVNRGEEGSSVI